VRLTPANLALMEEALYQREHGQIDMMESAIGALVIGQTFGWRVLYIVHSYESLHAYCDYLGIKSFKEHCPEVGPYAMRNKGFRLLQKFQGIFNHRGKFPRQERISIVPT
jgi:hypothetical protein